MTKHRITICINNSVKAELDKYRAKYPEERIGFIVNQAILQYVKRKRNLKLTK